MVALGSLVGAGVFFGGAWLWWHRIVDFNRWIVGGPGNRLQRRGEEVNRWFGTAFFTVCGLLALSVAVRAVFGW